MQRSHSHRNYVINILQKLKRNSSPRPYVQAKLNDNDEQGFAAAGFLLWKKGRNNDVQVLMARENRNGRDRLNFLDGKRLRKMESAIEVALRKVNMESGQKLSRDALEGMKHAPLVYWSGREYSKYALFFYEITSWRDRDIDSQANGLSDEEVKKLEWVSCKNLKTPSFVRDELHGYARDMVKNLSDSTCGYDVLGTIGKRSELKL